MTFNSYITDRFNEITDIRDTTKKMYKSVLNTLQTNFAPTATNISFVEDFKGVSTFLNGKSKGNKRNTYAGILKLLPPGKLASKYKRAMKRINIVLINEADENKMTTTQKDVIGDITIKELKKIPKKALMRYEEEAKTPNQKYMALQHYALSMLLLKEQFVPRLDYRTVKIIDKEIDNDGNGNFALITKPYVEIILNTFKNVDKMGTIRFKLNKKVADAVRKLIDERDIDTPYLFYNKQQDKSYTQKRFSELIPIMFKLYGAPPLTMNSIRTLRETALQMNPAYQRLTEAEKTVLHRQFFHSKAIAVRFYKKLK